MKPESVNILGKEYKIIYCDKPSEVDIYKRTSLWGQIDYWTRTIRVYANDNTMQDVLQILLHEILHGIVSELHISTIYDAKDEEEVIDLLALALADVLERNNWIQTELEAK